MVAEQKFVQRIPEKHVSAGSAIDSPAPSLFRGQYAKSIKSISLSGYLGHIEFSSLLVNVA